MTQLAHAPPNRQKDVYAEKITGLPESTAPYQPASESTEECH